MHDVKRKAWQWYVGQDCSWALIHSGGFHSNTFLGTLQKEEKARLESLIPKFKASPMPNSVERSGSSSKLDSKRPVSAQTVGTTRVCLEVLQKQSASCSVVLSTRTVR
jgi:hypothetical protein